MKRVRQRHDEEEHETSTRRGQRMRKPPAKLMEHASTPPVSDVGKKVVQSVKRRKGESNVANEQRLASARDMLEKTEIVVKSSNAQDTESRNDQASHSCSPVSEIASSQNENDQRAKLQLVCKISSESGEQNQDSALNSTDEHLPESKEMVPSEAVVNAVLSPASRDSATVSGHSSLSSNVFLAKDSDNEGQDSLSVSLEDTNQGKLDISETFITIETKQGLSSEKIPFSQFLKKVVVDRDSGSVKLDLGQLLASCVASGNLPETYQSELERGDAELFKPSSSSSSLSVKTPDPNADGTNVQQKHQTIQGKGHISTVKPVAKRRGRPPKIKQTAQVTNEVQNLQDLDFITSETVKSESLLVGSSKNAVNSLKKDESGFNNSPRRSRRTPAKNSRFGDDFVDSITLGKVASTSSTWNTQLMTLALAAERHKNKPQKVLTSGTSSDKVQEFANATDVQDESEVSHHRESDTEDSNSNVNFKEKKDVAQREFIDHQNSSNRRSQDEKNKTSGWSLRGPKTLKKYEPVDPVVKRSLQEAFKHSVESTANLLCPTVHANETSDSQNSSFYYTIMEPKIEAKGHGLLIEKSNDTVNFRTLLFNGNLSDTGELTKYSKSYPQDRYFSCDLCENLFSSSNLWLQHNKYVHNRTIDSFESSVNNTAGKGKFTCEFCEQRFPHKVMLDIHIKRKRHSEIKTFRCTLCKESFATHKAREEHWMMSHPARSCGLCGKQFTNIVMLRRHINHNCHGARFRKTVVINETNAEDNMVIPCENTTAGEKELRETDENESENDDVDDAEKGVNAEEDDDDNDIEIDSNEVKNEVGKVKCDLCATEFSTSSGLWYHKLEVHHEYYPQGYKDKLKEKLEKNKSILLTAQEAELHKATEGNKSKFFVLLKPKWPDHHSKLGISVEDKDFTFKLSEEKYNVLETLPHNSFADAPSKKETSFECVQCGETFQFASNYREHRSRVHGECFEVLRLLGAFQCTLCSDTFPCQFMLDKHLKKHVGKKLLPCTLCGLYFHKIQERRMHWKTAHPGIGCPNCGKMYASIKYLQKHISLNCQDHFPPTKKFLEFQKKQHSDFEMSKSEKKVEKKIIQCHLCPKLCSSVHGWRRHMSEAHEDSGFSKLSNTCIICNELVYGYKALEKHLLENHAVESGLPVEEEDGMVEEALKKCEIDITAYRKAGRNSAEIYQDEEGNFHCPSCPKTHPDIRALRTHMRIHVNMNLECSICNKTFKNPTLLKQHLQRHRKDAVYTCDTCHKKFLTLPKLNKHRKVHHSTGNFVCELCGMSFALNDYLQKHKRCHTDKRPHCCSICGKSFRSKPELRVHVLIHTRETPYKCQYCSRGFSQKGNYRIHLAQHTGEKPYQCDQCEISFALLCHLKRHKNTHDQMINYRCIWCDKECTQRKHMQMHVQRVHKEDFFQYEEQMKLETPIPIAPSQVKLYNRRLGKVNKVRKQYRTRAQKCDSTIQQLMNGVVTKSEPMDEDTETSQNIVIDPIVEPMIETVSCDMPVTSHENGGLEILVSDDHQNYAKQGITTDLLGPDPTNVEIVMGENNEINIIIKDPSTLQEVIGGQTDLSQLTTGPVQVHESLQQAVEALVTHARTMGDDDVQESLGVNELEKGAAIESTDVLSYDPAPNH